MKRADSARFWTAPVLWRFLRADVRGCPESGRGQPQSKTLARQTTSLFGS
jgi:hypothetical protein